MSPDLKIQRDAERALRVIAGVSIVLELAGFALLIAAELVRV